MPAGRISGLVEGVQSGATFTEAPELAIEDEFALFAVAENFSAEDSLRRTIWSEISKGRLIIRDDARADASAPWTTIRTYELKRR